GPADRAQSLCDGQWVLLPGHIVCLADVGTPPGPSHFPLARQFCWAADKPYRAAGAERWDGFLPEEVRARWQEDRPICLFVRGRGQEAFTYVGRLGPSNNWRPGSPGVNHGEASFDLSPPLPSRVWAALGGLRPEGGAEASLDASLARL